MQLPVLAIFTIILSFTVLETVTAEKHLNCCTKVSTKKITAPITGFRFQKKNLPCITAVIFETTEGQVCSHWQEKWVQETIRSIRQRQNLATTKTIVTATPITTTNNANATEAISQSVTVTSTNV